METNRYYRIERQPGKTYNDLEWETINCTSNETVAIENVRRLRLQENLLQYKYQVVVVTENTEVLDV